MAYPFFIWLGLNFSSIKPKKMGQGLTLAIL